MRVIPEGSLSSSFSSNEGGRVVIRYLLRYRNCQDWIRNQENQEQPGVAPLQWMPQLQAQIQLRGRGTREHWRDQGMTPTFCVHLGWCVGVLRRPYADQCTAAAFRSFLKVGMLQIWKLTALCLLCIYMWFV